MMRKIATHLIATYIGAGLFGGLLFWMAIPAMNLIGVSYYALTWPAQIYCASSSHHCDPMPNSGIAKWFFTFPEAHMGKSEP